MRWAAQAGAAASAARGNRKERWGIAPALVASLMLAPANAQNPAGSTAVATDRVEVRLVNVDALVTDGRGQPVTDLGVEDFEVFEDGRAVEITNFARGPIRASTSDVERAQTTSEDPAAGTAVSTEGDDGPRFVVYFDNRYLESGGRKRVVRQLVRWVEEIGQGRTWAVIERDGHPNPALRFSSDPRAVIEAVERIERESSVWGMLQEQQRQAVLDRMESFGYCTQNAVADAEAYAQQVLAQVEEAIADLDLVVVALGGVEGRKALLYVGDGLQVKAAEDIFWILHQTCEREGGRLLLIPEQYAATNPLHALAARANATRTTLYALEARGLSPPAAGSVDHGPQVGDTVTSPSGTVLGSTLNETPGRAGGASAWVRDSSTDSIRTHNRQNSLFFLAEETGGRAVLNANRFLRDLRQIGDELASSYSLAFVPRAPADGRVHQIRVRVRRDGVEVRHRRSYLAEPTVVAPARTLAAALTLGAEHDEHDLRVGAVAQRPMADGNWAVGFEVSVALGALALLPDGERLSGSVSVLLAVSTEVGGDGGVREIEVPVSLDAARLESNPALRWSYRFDAVLEAGERELAVGILDRVANRTSTVLVSLRVGEGG